MWFYLFLFKKIHIKQAQAKTQHITSLHNKNKHKLFFLFIALNVVNNCLGLATASPEAQEKNEADKYQTCDNGNQNGCTVQLVHNRRGRRRGWRRWWRRRRGSWRRAWGRSHHFRAAAGTNHSASVGEIRDRPKLAVVSIGLARRDHVDVSAATSGESAGLTFIFAVVCIVGLY